MTLIKWIETEGQKADRWVRQDSGVLHFTLTLPELERIKSTLREAALAAERPAPTCATCEFALAHLCKNQRLIQSLAIGWFVPPSPDFGCTLHEPAPPGPVAQEKDK